MHTGCKISDRPNTFTGFIPDLLSILVKLSTWGNMTTGYPLKFLWHEATSRRRIVTPFRCFPHLLPPSFLACPLPFPRTPKSPFPSFSNGCQAGYMNPKRQNTTPLRATWPQDVYPHLNFCSMKLLLEGVLLLLQESNQTKHYLGLIYQKLLRLLQLVSQLSHSKRRKIQGGTFNKHVRITLTASDHPTVCESLPTT